VGDAHDARGFAVYHKGDFAGFKEVCCPVWFGDVFFNFNQFVFFDNRHVQFPETACRFFGDAQACEVVFADKFFVCQVKIVQQAFVATGKV
jgi:hypothetical protein